MRAACIATHTHTKNACFLLLAGFSLHTHTHTQTHYTWRMMSIRDAVNLRGVCERARFVCWMCLWRMVRGSVWGDALDRPFSRVFKRHVYCGVRWVRTHVNGSVEQQSFYLFLKCSKWLFIFSVIFLSFFFRSRVVVACIICFVWLLVLCFVC